MTNEKLKQTISEADIKTAGVNNKLDDTTFATFAKFMRLRFPQEAHISYISEWAGRFARGSPEDYMDKISLEAYKKAKGVKSIEYDIAVTVLAKKLDDIKQSAFDLSFILSHCYDKSKEEIMQDIAKAYAKD